MNYYIVVDKCPTCNSLQKRWVIPNYTNEETINCVECHASFFDSSNIYQIILADNVSYSVNTVSF